MKKILSLFVVIIAYSCSTSSDENGNSNTQDTIIETEDENVISDLDKDIRFEKVI